MRVPWSAVLVVLFALTAVAHAEPPASSCAMPPEYVTPPAPLPSVGAALSATKPVEILALGSGSTVGETGGASGPAFAANNPNISFPYRMLASLQMMRPDAQFHLTVRGARNLTAEGMLPILRKELANHPYNLVLWQTGTVEAVRGVRPDTMHGVLDSGVDEAEQAHADVVLIDPQFSRFLRANADLSPYQAVLQQVAGRPGVNLFHRFDLTQFWTNVEQVDVERAPHEQRAAAMAALNACLGEALARYILTGATEH